MKGWGSKKVEQRRSLRGGAPKGGVPNPEKVEPRRVGPGVSHDNQRAQTCTFEGPGLQKHHQNSTRRPQRERQKERNFGRSGGWWSGGVQTHNHTKQQPTTTTTTTTRELKHALPQAGGPTQSQLSRPMSSGHHISMEHRLRRKQINSDTNVSNEKIFDRKTEKRNFFFGKIEKRK